jgi:hypothetical protein
MDDQILPDMPDVEQLMTLPQIEQEFGIPYRTSHAAVRSGRLIHVDHPGRRILIPRAQAEQFKIRYDFYKAQRKSV